MDYIIEQNILRHVNRIKGNLPRRTPVIMPTHSTRTAQVVRIGKAIAVCMCVNDELRNEYELERTMIQLLSSTINHAALVDKLNPVEILTIFDTELPLPQDIVTVDFFTLTNLTNLELGDVAGTFEICMRVLMCVSNNANTFLAHMSAALVAE